METHYPGYLALLEELRGSLDQLTGLAKEKNAAVLKDDLLALDEVLKQEQAMTLNLRGLELRRLKLVGQLGLEGTTLSALPAKCPPELAAETDQVVSDVQMSYRAYRSSANMVRTTLELNLHQIEKTITASGIDPVLGGAGYAAPGAEPPKNMKTDFRA